MRKVTPPKTSCITDKGAGSGLGPTSLFSVHILYMNTIPEDEGAVVGDVAPVSPRPC